MEANEPEKKIPSTAAKATRREAKVDSRSLIQRRAQLAFLVMQGTKCHVRQLNAIKSMGEVLTSVNGIKEVGTLLGLLDIGVDEQGVSFGVDVLHHDLEAVEATGLGDLDL